MSFFSFHALNFGYGYSVAKLAQRYLWSFLFAVAGQTFLSFHILSFRVDTPFYWNFFVSSFPASQVVLRSFFMGSGT